MALGLHRFIQQVLGRADPWMSEQDIAVGARWPEALRDALVGSGFCVICVTKENVGKPWLNYEAGVIRDGLNKPTAPWMLDITPAEFPLMPLNPLQGRACTRGGTLELVNSLNRAMGDRGMAPAIVSDLFERCWPDLETELEAARKLIESPGPKRTAEDLLNEVVRNTRALLELGRLVTDMPTRRVTPSTKLALDSDSDSDSDWEESLIIVAKEYLAAQPTRFASLETILEHLQNNMVVGNLSVLELRGLLGADGDITIHPGGIVALVTKV
jgi:hypothetical protein